MVGMDFISFLILLIISVVDGTVPFPDLDFDLVSTVDQQKFAPVERTIGPIRFQ
jgi:hypothetical protein